MKNTIYIIIEENGYDGFNIPYNEVYYTDEEIAEKEAKRLNKLSGSKRDYFFVQDLTPAK